MNVVETSSSICDKLQGLNLPYRGDVDMYEYTSEGLIQLEIDVIYYKNQIETSIIRALENETREAQKEVLEQIYTMLQKL